MIGIIGGTNYDTKVGIQLFKQNHINCKGYPISLSPDEQDLFQQMNFINQVDIIDQIFKKIIKDQINEVVVFCNSLSFSVDFECFEEKYNIKVHTVKRLLQNTEITSKNIFLLTANKSCMLNVKNFLQKRNKNFNISGYYSLNLINRIEQGAFDFNEVSKILNQKLKKDSLLFVGCTHYANYYHNFVKEYPIRVIESGHLLLKFISAFTHKHLK